MWREGAYGWNGFPWEKRGVGGNWFFEKEVRPESKGTRVAVSQARLGTELR